MLNIFLASLSVGLGTYILRKGNLFGLILYFFRKNIMSYETLIYTLVGIILNLIGIYFWQESKNSNLPYQSAISIYLSLTIIVGIIISTIFENVKFNINLFLGSIFIISGIIILSSENA